MKDEPCITSQQEALLLNTPAPCISSFILKVASRCNLNCSYCYVYNQADSTWKSRPPIMPDAVFEATLDRIRRHCIRSNQRTAHIQFHGGEPLLVGASRFGRWCERIRDVLSDTVTVELGMQTNGSLLDEKWIEVLRAHDVLMGVSIDGPKDVHDAFRKDRKGRGSYERVEQGLRLLQCSNVPHRILSVIPLGSEPLKVHHHLVSLGSKSITYILPDFTHDNVASVRRLYGPTPCADFLIPIFDDWWFTGTLELIIRDLWNVARIILGGRSQIETFGNRPPHYVFIETDGEIEGLDCLRSCGEGISRINLNVRHADFSDILASPTMHGVAIFHGMPLPTGCLGCAERETCAGGYLPHRYSRAERFDNPSVWCADILEIFAHIRRRLGVPVEETQSRRTELQNLDTNALNRC